VIEFGKMYFVRITSWVLLLLVAGCEAPSNGTEGVSRVEASVELWSTPVVPQVKVARSLILFEESGFFHYWEAGGAIDAMIYHPTKGIFSEKEDMVVLRMVAELELHLFRGQVEGVETLERRSEDGKPTWFLFKREHVDIENPFALTELTDYEKMRQK